MKKKKKTFLIFISQIK